MNNIWSKFKPGKKNKDRDAVDGSGNGSIDRVASEIGQPFGIKHNIHVGYNPETGQIEGLPMPWIEWLSQANIGKLEQSTNPKAVIDALKYYAHSVKKKATEPEGIKYLTTQEDIDADFNHQRGINSNEWPSKDSLESISSSTSKSNQTPTRDSGNRSSEELLDLSSSAASCQSVSNGNNQQTNHEPSPEKPKRIVKHDSEGPIYANVNIKPIVPPKPVLLLDNHKHLNHHHDSEELTTKCDKLQVADNKILESNGNQVIHNKTVINAAVSTVDNAQSPQMRRKKDKPVVNKSSEEDVMKRLYQVVNQNDDPKVRFEIIKKIGSGASGTVYTALDKVTNKKVAIKTMDLAQQPKKELIITEIMVMRENQ